MKNMEKIQNLLNKVDVIRQEAKKLRDESYKKGEEFDVFSVVGFWNEEVKFHSAMIAELLDPHGSHGAGDFYLKQFLKILKRDDFPLDTTQVQPKIKERYIGPVTETTGGEIDIIIEDGKKHALIIENKPGKKDQENQMLRYRNYAEENYEDSILIYLTKDGREASDYSTGRERFDYKRLSYNDILSWLDKCSCKSLPDTNVKAVINQYKLHIKKILGITMDDNNSKELLELLTQNENNALAVKEILCMRDRWLNSIIEEYLFKPLGEYAKSKKMKFEKNTNTRDFSIYKDSWKYYRVFLWPSDKTGCIRVGVSYCEDAQPNQENKISEKDYSKMGCLSKDPDEIWPYGWRPLPSNMDSFVFEKADKIINKKVFGWVKLRFDEILNEIEKNKLRMP